MKLCHFALLTFLVCAPLAAQDLTGTWSGTYSLSVQLSSCQNKTYSTSGTMTINFVQTGPSLVGRVDMTNDLDFSGGCTPSTIEATHVIVGGAAAGTATWHYSNDSSGTTYSGTINGDSMNARISDGNGLTGTVALTRSPVQTPAVSVTGSWSGTYSFKDVCPSGGTTSYTGPFTLGLFQSGSVASGVATMPNIPLYDRNCATLATVTMSMVVSGVVSGSTFSGSVFDPSGSFDFPISATIGNSGMSGTVAGASQTSTTGTFTVTQSSAQAPASDFAGTWSGSYNEIDNETLTCVNVGSLSFDGPASLSIVHAGPAIAGALIFQNVSTVSADIFGDCVIVNVGEEVLPLWGTLTGNTLSVQVPLGNGAVGSYTINLAASGISGTITDSFGDRATFTATRTAAPPPPSRRRAVHP